MTDDVEIGIVSRLGLLGDGIVDAPGGPVYVPGALPGERIIRRNRKISIQPPLSTARRDAYLCPHFGQCGGCALQHMTDTLYRQWKATLLVEALATQGIKADIRPGFTAPLNSRRRAVISVKRDGDDIIAGFHAAGSNEIVAIRHCAVLTPAIVGALEGIRAMSRLLLPRKSEARVTVLDTPHGLDVAFEAGRTDLTPDQRHTLALIGSSHPIARLSVKGEPVLIRATPALTVAGVAVTPPPGAFVQAAAVAEQAMQSLAVEAVAKSKRAADLFCGLGTFALALARETRVLALDSDRALVNALAQATRHTQGLKSIETGVRDLLHDPLSPRELDGFDAVVLDPPRAGAKSQAEALARSKVRTVIAVSCNPTTLARDLRILIDGGYRLQHATPIDQFLYSPHLEVVAVLRR